MNEVKFKKCNKCGALVHLINDCKCKDNCLSCCDVQMEDVIVHDGSEENIHYPFLKKKDKKVFVTMEHVMDNDHYIEKIIIINDDGMHIYDYNPGDEIAFAVQYNGVMSVYAYCNKHGLWLSKL